MHDYTEMFPITCRAQNPHHRSLEASAFLLTRRHAHVPNSISLLQKQKYKC